jgi:purine-binding chemotaxis protein CheW
MAVKVDLDCGQQVVVFTAGSEEYGLGIGQVQEIIRLLPITRVPCSPEHVEGVINLRGNVVPVIDLHRRLALGQRANSWRSRIIIVRTQDMIAGFIVDSVNEVLDLPAGHIEPPLDGKEEAHLKGIGKSSGRVILLLNLENVLRVGMPE